MFKKIFGLAFLLIAVVWTLVTLELLNVYTMNISFLSDLSRWVNSFATNGVKNLGLKLVLIGGAVFLALNSIGIVLSLIPIIGKVLKTLWKPLKFIVGSLVNFLAIGAIVLGIVLLVVDIQIPGLENVVSALAIAA